MEQRIEQLEARLDEVTKILFSTLNALATVAEGHGYGATREVESIIQYANDKLDLLTGQKNKS
ncbi:hypothetical protein MH117_09575 [Paenibacillus sp. ACRRX]|uniref:hypothetical protein n=1 Tax=Paenibacillus sp. ACRRX TaxID=2918206 RepID=UPI001EF5AD59|nr:hypothetical protein [Paenibacillus sp. ACRRX]MCG7407672.1 hypothetical protein [Paenibacillus sp. ACRRX]